MAFIDEDKLDPVNCADFYNVSVAVGLGCQNYYEDVMLVQFFLQRIYMNKDMQPKKPSGTMKVDGVFGPITRSWIFKLQTDLQKNGKAILADGIINRADNDQDNYVTSISNTVYTIRLMNTMLRNEQKPLYSTLPVNQEVPPLLRLSFLRMNAEKPDADFYLGPG